MVYTLFKFIVLSKLIIINKKKISTIVFNYLIQKKRYLIILLKYF